MANRKENERRAMLAMDAVEFFGVQSGQRDEPLETNIVDLLANLMHLSKKAKLDFEKILRMAGNHFYDETVGSGK